MKQWDNETTGEKDDRTTGQPQPEIVAKGWWDNKKTRQWDSRGTMGQQDNWSSRLLDNQTMRQWDSWTIKKQDNGSTGQRDNWTTIIMDNSTTGKQDNETTGQLIAWQHDKRKTGKINKAEVILVKYFIKSTAITISLVVQKINHSNQSFNQINQI